MTPVQKLWQERSVDSRQSSMQEWMQPFEQHWLMGSLLSILDQHQRLSGAVKPAIALVPGADDDSLSVRSVPFTHIREVALLQPVWMRGWRIGVSTLHRL